MRSSLFVAALAATLTIPAVGADQTVPGAGNAAAAELARKSPIVRSAQEFLIQQAHKIRRNYLRETTLDAISNPSTCIRHRANLTDADKTRIVNTLLAQGLIDPGDSNFPGGFKAGVFPPVLDDGKDCPKLPMPFWAAPGSAYGSHHSYPGGLPVHEANNDIADVNLADEYRGVYGTTNRAGFAVVDRGIFFEIPGLREERRENSAVYIDEDIIVGAPLWHDWAKPIVFQWNADGSEFLELNFGGNGTTDAFGQSGNSKTGGHHIIGVAEAMKRGLSPAFVITQASAHSNPTLGNEYKVVNWLRAGAIIAQIDPVATGYLTIDSQGHYRLPALRALGSLNLLPGQTNLLAEYTLHNLSDADFSYSIPAITSSDVILKALAPRYGYDPNNVAVYQTKFRNPALSFITGERLLMIYSQRGLDGVAAQLDILRNSGVL